LAGKVPRSRQKPALDILIFQLRVELATDRVDFDLPEIPHILTGAAEPGGHLWLASGCLQDTLGTGGEDLSNVGHFQGDS